MNSRWCPAWGRLICELRACESRVASQWVGSQQVKGWMLGVVRISGSSRSATRRLPTASYKSYNWELCPISFFTITSYNPIILRQKVCGHHVHGFSTFCQFATSRFLTRNLQTHYLPISHSRPAFVSKGQTRQVQSLSPVILPTSKRSWWNLFCH